MSVLTTSSYSLCLHGEKEGKKVISRAKSHGGSARSTARDPKKVRGGRACPGKQENPPTQAPKVIEYSEK